MNRISEKLASLQYTTWNLVVLLLWIGWGMLMASSDAFRKGFQDMNNVLVRDWLISGETGFPVLKVWFIGLCFLMTLLGINLIFCSWEKIFRILRARFNTPRFFMLMVHAIFGFVALFHLGGLMLGYEHNNIRLGEGKRYNFGNGYEVEVKNVNVPDDYMILERSSRYISRDDFDYTKNFAEVVLRRDGKEVGRGNIYLLNPMKYRDIQVTLSNFVRSPEAGDISAAGDKKPWVTLTVSRNPALKIFLILYPAMIIGIFFYLILTWRTSKEDGIGE